MFPIRWFLPLVGSYLSLVPTARWFLFLVVYRLLLFLLSVGFYPCLFLALAGSYHPLVLTSPCSYFSAARWFLFLDDSCLLLVLTTTWFLPFAGFRHALVPITRCFYLSLVPTTGWFLFLVGSYHSRIRAHNTRLRYIPKALFTTIIWTMALC